MIPTSPLMTSTDLIGLGLHCRSPSTKHQPKVSSPLSRDRFDHHSRSPICSPMLASAALGSAILDSPILTTRRLSSRRLRSSLAVKVASLAWIAALSFGVLYLFSSIDRSAKAAKYYIQPVTYPASSRWLEFGEEHEFLFGLEEAARDINAQPELVPYWSHEIKPSRLQHALAIVARGPRRLTKPDLLTLEELEQANDTADEDALDFSANTTSGSFSKPSALAKARIARQRRTVFE
ncbi:uncharacterized protein L969DRAFT_85175 [Mixia osmundae IAM 14324]|uniref:Uncharacterized protein n=1 Tax=Mixia osmundae (strain CBS 9802 / IAM 14324 / JCM 22182 / KY 12970) TaxID=764103 RepID=G7DY42_MIXOS|nr:uncharacterized protein L969DRAFT_85175 [Mixia osmundae IAM 14324]KEI41404.1 hypothetical protein L969DRAFT_85175 [Mixia osmundae IAM 14324]GAA95502.1 hypothetical protein E5Q_02157 [Mixia osmundae IAM 14324]